MATDTDLHEVASTLSIGTKDSVLNEISMDNDTQLFHDVLRSLLTTDDNELGFRPDTNLRSIIIRGVEYAIDKNDPLAYGYFIFLDIYSKVMDNELETIGNDGEEVQKRYRYDSAIRYKAIPHSLFDRELREKYSERLSGNFTMNDVDRARSLIAKVVILSLITRTTLRSSYEDRYDSEFIKNSMQKLVENVSENAERARLSEKFFKLENVIENYDGLYKVETGRSPRRQYNMISLTDGKLDGALLWEANKKDSVLKVKAFESNDTLCVFRDIQKNSGQWFTTMANGNSVLQCTGTTVPKVLSNFAFIEGYKKRRLIVIPSKIDQSIDAVNSLVGNREPLEHAFIYSTVPTQAKKKLEKHKPKPIEGGVKVSYEWWRSIIVVLYIVFAVGLTAAVGFANPNRREHKFELFTDAMFVAVLLLTTALEFLKSFNNNLSLTEYWIRGQRIISSDSELIKFFGLRDESELAWVCSKFSKRDQLVRLTHENQAPFILQNDSSRDGIQFDYEYSRSKLIKVGGLFIGDIMITPDNEVGIIVKSETGFVYENLKEYVGLWPVDLENNGENIESSFYVQMN